MTPDDFLGRAGAGAGAFDAFDFGRHLHGAFGGVFGGALAAATVRVARDAAPPGRVPASLDCRFLRALPAGRARADATVLHTGRSMTTVVVDLVDERDRTTTHSTVTLVDPAALHPLALDATPVPWATDDAAGEPWPQPPGFHAPIIDTLTPRTVPLPAFGTWSGPILGPLQVPKGAGTAVATAIEVPWDDPGASAEAVCLAADLCVGPPVAHACRGRKLAHPNPDLSLRFAGGPLAPGARLVAAGRLSSVAGGVATVAIDVATVAIDVATGGSGSGGGRPAGVGVSCSVLLPVT